MSFFADKQFLYEQICRDGKSSFSAFNVETGKSTTVSSITVSGDRIEPINGADVELGAVKLPSAVRKYGSTRNLLARVERHIRKFLDVSPAYLNFAVYYVLLTWVYDRFYTLPYLRALGDTGCGKSRFLDVIGGLCYKPISASGCVTPAPIYRMLRKWAGTLVLDEADIKDSSEYNEVVTILNCGFEKGRPVIRCVKDNPDKVQILPVYGPKVFATRRRFKDAALEARCLTEIMQETDRDDIPAVLGTAFFEEQQRLRDMLLQFRLRNFYSIKPEATSGVDLGSVEPRLRQISEAITSLFASEPEVLRSYGSFIRNHQKNLIEQRAATPTGQIVEALLSTVTGVTLVTLVTGEKVIPVAAGELAVKVDMAPGTAGAILKTLGLQTKVARVEGKPKRCIVFDEKKLTTLKRRYVVDEAGASPNDGDVTAVTTVTSETGDSGGREPGGRDGSGKVWRKISFMPGTWTD
jgi:energy-coupling factor transporter ATP-binding protein EcfA2